MGTGSCHRAALWGGAGGIWAILMGIGCGAGLGRLGRGDEEHGGCSGRGMLLQGMFIRGCSGSGMLCPRDALAEGLLGWGDALGEECLPRGVFIRGMLWLRDVYPGML